MNIEELQKTISGNDKVMVKFSAPWCGPCKAIKPVFDELKDNRKDVVFVDIDVDEDSDIANEFGVMSIPTMMMFKNGQFVNKLTGLTQKGKIEELIG